MYSQSIGDAGGFFFVIRLDAGCLDYIYNPDKNIEENIDRELQLDLWSYIHNIFGCPITHRYSIVVSKFYSQNDSAEPYILNICMKSSIFLPMGKPL